MFKKITAAIVLATISILSYAEGKKVALVIGNSNYSDFFKPLSTPRNDAEAMEWALRYLGYEVIAGHDADRGKMASLLDEFQRKASDADVALFYYSGHGGYTAESNYYLIPSGDYDILSNLPARCLDFISVERALKSTGARLQLAFVDACRSSIEATKGWLDYDPDKRPSLQNDASVGKGRAIYFGTSESTAAFAGKGKLSIFTQALINHIFDSKPFDSVVWESIEKEVISINEKQKPTKNRGTLINDFVLNDSGNVPSSTLLEGYEVISFKAEPGNADIKINGKTYSNPVSMKLYYDKTYDVEISADGYEPYENSIKIVPGPFVQRDYTLSLTKKAPATLRVTSNVQSPEIYFDKVKINQKAPCTITTYSGMHSIRLHKNNYYANTVTLNLKPGANSEHIILDKEPLWFFDWDYDHKQMISYHFSPKYQIGLSYLFSLDNHIVFGLHLASSPGLFKGLSVGTYVQQINISEPIVSGGSYTVHKEFIDLRNSEYSPFVDPNNEAVHYDANGLYMAEAGYQPWNGVNFTLGLGAASHSDRYYMENSYSIEKTVIINELTGETSTTYGDYKKTGNDVWYKSKVVWSPAIRLGSLISIPFSDVSDWSINIGGGYTYLPKNTALSSWDVSIGVGFYFDWSGSSLF